SAFCLFAGGLVLLLTAWLQPPPLRTRLAFFVAAAILILIGLEEVSWFQRLADVPTPDWLVDLNHQHELNLHNVATGESENLFYMGAFALCVLGRFSSDIIGFP